MEFCNTLGYGTKLCRPVNETWWLLEERCQAMALGPSSIEPCQSVHAAVPRAFIFFTTQTIPSSSLHRPIKAWFSTPAGQPGRFAARDRWEAGEAREGGGGQWASIWAQGGCWALASNWTENSPAPKYRSGGATTLTQLDNLPCTNKQIHH